MRICDKCYKKLEGEDKTFTNVFMKTFNQNRRSKKREKFELCEECYHEIRSFFELTYTMTFIDNQEG